MTDFDLRALVRDELETSDESNPHAIAKAVCAKVPDEHLRTALAYCLPRLVLNMAQEQRRQREPAEPPPEPERPGPPTLAPARPRSRWDNASELYVRFLRQRECISPNGESRWKMLGEMTCADVLAAAALRESNARANIITAARYKKLATAMESHGATTVADLPEQVALEAMR